MKITTPSLNRIAAVASSEKLTWPKKQTKII